MGSSNTPGGMPKWVPISTAQELPSGPWTCAATAAPPEVVSGPTISIAILTMCRSFWTRLERRFPTCQSSSLAIAWAGLIVLQPRLTQTHPPTGLIVSAPSIHVADEFIPWLRKLAAFGSRWFPWARLARMGCSSMSRDKAVVDDYRTDPLVHHGRIPTRTGAEIIRVGEETRRQADRIELPLLILQGTADAVVLCEATEALYQAVGSGDKTLRLYPGLYHDLPREPEKEEVFAEITSWILARCR